MIPLDRSHTTSYWCSTINYLP